MLRRLSLPVLALAAVASFFTLAPERAPAARPSASAESYFVVRQDFRRCMYPFCGGVWVSQANGGRLACVEGRGAECYVPNFNWSALGLRTSGPTVVVKGTLGVETIDGFGDFNHVTFSQGWSTAESNGDFSEDLYEVTDTGIRCITSPCPSYEAVRLNGSRSFVVDGMDFSSFTSSYWPVYNDSVIVRGSVSKGKTKVITVDEALLAGDTIDPAVYCEVDSDCTYTSYTTEVTDTADCYCPMCPTHVVNVTTAERYADSYQTYCSDTRMICPVPACIRPPPVACVSNQCAFTSFEL